MKLTGRIIPTVATLAFGLMVFGAYVSAPSSAADNSPANAQLTLGRTLAEDKCSMCHGADEGGLAGSSPAITRSGALKNYTLPLFERLMATGVKSNGKPAPPTVPVFKWPAAKADAVYAYLQKLK